MFWNLCKNAVLLFIWAGCEVSFAQRGSSRQFFDGKSLLNHNFMVLTQLINSSCKAFLHFRSESYYTASIWKVYCRLKFKKYLSSRFVEKNFAIFPLHKLHLQLISSRKMCTIIFFLKLLKIFRQVGRAEIGRLSWSFLFKIFFTTPCHTIIIRHRTVFILQK